MINHLNIKKVILTLLLVFCSLGVQAEVLDTIVAVVEDDVILDRELQKEVMVIQQRIQQSKAELPPAYVLRKQVLEKMIIDKLQRQLAEKAGITVNEEMLNTSAADKLQRQLAEKAGITVNEEMLNTSAADIARRNNMDLEQFRAELESQGISYQSFLDNMRNEIIINQLRGREIGGRIKVTDREVEHYMETQDKIGEQSTQYHLGHILIAVKEDASSTDIQKASSKANDLVKKLRGGQDFSQTAISDSDDANALKGGDLGWRTLSEIPTLFVNEIHQLSQGDVSEPIRSPSGFHIIKMLELKGLDNHVIIKTKVRHILIKTNELVDDAEAKKRLKYPPCL